MKQKLQDILDKINGLQAGDDQGYQTYIQEIQNSLALIQTIDPGDNPMLGSWKQMAVEELNKELEERMSEKFFTGDETKKRSDFMFSKSTVSLSITNIIMNL